MWKATCVSAALVHWSDKGKRQFKRFRRLCLGRHGTWERHDAPCVICNLNLVDVSAEIGWRRYALLLIIYDVILVSGNETARANVQWWRDGDRVNKTFCSSLADLWMLLPRKMLWIKCKTADWGVEGLLCSFPPPRVPTLPLCVPQHNVIRLFPRYKHPIVSV